MAFRGTHFLSYNPQIRRLVKGASGAFHSGEPRSPSEVRQGVRLARSARPSSPRCCNLENTAGYSLLSRESGLFALVEVRALKNRASGTILARTGRVVFSAPWGPTSRRKRACLLLVRDGGKGARTRQRLIWYPEFKQRQESRAHGIRSLRHGKY